MRKKSEETSLTPVALRQTLPGETLCRTCAWRQEDCDRYYRQKGEVRGGRVVIMECDGYDEEEKR